LGKKNKQEKSSLQYKKNLKARNESVYSELPDIDRAIDESVTFEKTSIEFINRSFITLKIVANVRLHLLPHRITMGVILLSCVSYSDRKDMLSILPVYLAA
jgi:hypothetical protein